MQQGLGQLCVRLALLVSKRFYSVQPEPALSLSRSPDRCGWSRAYGPMCAWGPAGIIVGIETLPPFLLEPNSSLSLSLSGSVLHFFYLPASVPFFFACLISSPLVITTQPAAGSQNQSAFSLAPQKPLSPNVPPSPPPHRHKPAGRTPSKNGYGLAVRTPVLRSLHLLQHRARGKLLEKPDPNETSYMAGEDHA